MSELAKKGTLGGILSASRIISESDVQAALEEQRREGCRFGEALVRLGCVSQEDIDWALSNQLDIPYIHLKRSLVEEDVLPLIPADMARTFVFIPLFIVGDELNIAIADPLNRAAIEAIEYQTGLRVNLSVALASEIVRLIDDCYGSAGCESLGFESSSFSPKVLQTINADLGGSSLLDCLLILLLKNRLSSLSLQPFSDRIVVTGRRNGVSREIGLLSHKYYADFVRKVRKFAEIDGDAKLSSAGIFNFVYRSQLLSFHVALLPGHSGEYITFKLHFATELPEQLSNLELPDEQRAAFLRLAGSGHGITFFASRSARERSHFMNLLLEEIDTEGKNVIILGDDPVHIKERFPRISLPYAEADRARLIMDSLEHDPDIIVISDATERVPLSAACRAAMRGKLVLVGLEIRGTGNALRQLLKYQQNNSLLPNFINGLVAFKGINLLCPDCRTEYLPPDEELAALGLETIPQRFFRSSGCDACGYAGTHDRRFLLDVIEFDPDFLRVFEQADDVSVLDDYLAAKGYCGSRAEGLRLLMAGEVSAEEYIASVVM